MAKLISGAEYPLSKIFSSEFDYIIPSYQRPYAWSVEQAGELFDDLFDFYLRENEETYFLGSIVLIKDEGKPKSEVIDGQQRLTTLTILIAAIANQVDENSRNDFKNYLLEPGRASQGLKPKPRLAPRERDREFFSDYIQSLRFNELIALESKQLNNESQKNIQENGKLLHAALLDRFNGDSKKLCNFGSFLVQRCFLVVVSTPSQQSAFRVFSVMNSRGLDLQPTDIIKADVIGKIESLAERDDYNERWEEMEVQLGRSTFNDLFAYVRMIYAKEKAKRSMLEEFRHYVIEQQSPEKLISDVLEPYSEALAKLRNMNYSAQKNASNVNEYLLWLNKIDNSDWIPPAMLFLSKYRNDADYVLWFFERLERLAACIHVCAYNVNYRIERYAKIISALWDVGESKEKLECAIELTSKEMSTMREVLDGDVYNLTPRRRNYLILRLDSFLSDGAAKYDSSLLTIEHVLPQKVPGNSEWEIAWPDLEARKMWIHKLANLVPLNKRRNSSAHNYDFNKKKMLYFSGRENVSSYALTSQVLGENVWTKEVVAKRQNNLIAVISKNWRLEEEPD